jgi:hypothetical protein
LPVTNGPDDIEKIERCITGIGTTIPGGSLVVRKPLMFGKILTMLSG